MPSPDYLVAVAEGLLDTTDPNATDLQAGGQRINGHYHKYECEGLTNRTATSLAEGDVVALSSANADSVVLEDVQGSKRPLRVYVGTAALADGVLGEFSRGGKPTKIKSTGSIAIGEYFRKSATTKAVEGTGTNISTGAAPPSGAAGVATQAAAGGFVVGILFDIPAGAAGGMLVFRAVGASFPTSDFPALTKNVGTNWVDYTLDYDAATVESAYWEGFIPEGANVATPTLEIYFRMASAIANAVLWEVRTLTRAEGEAWDTAGNTDTFAAETVPGTAGMIGRVTKTLTTTGWAAGETLALRIDRKASDAGDTATGDAKFMFAILRF